MLFLFFVSVSLAVRYSRRHETCCVDNGYNTNHIWRFILITTTVSSMLSIVVDDSSCHSLPCEKDMTSFLVLRWCRLRISAHPARLCSSAWFVGLVLRVVVTSHQVDRREPQFQSGKATCARKTEYLALVGEARVVLPLTIDPALDASSAIFSRRCGCA